MTTIAMISVLGMPRVLASANFVRTAGAVDGVPLARKKTVPSKSAFMPRVATSGANRNTVTMNPLIRPTMPGPTTPRITASQTGQPSPCGSALERTAPRAIIPGTDRSRPRCWITRVWPAAAMARTDANGSMLSSGAVPRLPGAMSGLRTNRMIVAIQIALERPENMRRHRASRVVSDAVVIAQPSFVNREWRCR